MRKKHNDYNLANQKDRKNYLKNINTRIKDYADTFGTESQVYKNQVVKIKTLFPGRSDIFREREDGIFQLKTGKDYTETDKYFEGIIKHKYLDKPTTTEYLKTTLEKMQERGELPEDIKMTTELQGPPTSQKVFPTIKNLVISYAKEYSELAADIKEDIGFLYGYEDDSEVSQAISTLRMTGRRKTYEELEEIKKAINKAKQLGGYDENDPYKDF